jgi:hypothetical protein
MGVFSFDDSSFNTIAFKDEIWEVFDSRADHQKVMAEHLFTIMKLSCFTLKPDYIMRTCLYSNRFTLVFKVSEMKKELIGFASLNAEMFEMPRDVLLWDGKSRLSIHSVGPKRTTVAKQDTPVVHISSIVCDSKDNKDLGTRIVLFQKLLALCFEFEHRLLALEAIKPLDALFYKQNDFQTATETFYPTSFDDTVPMFCKIQEIALMKLFMSTEGSSIFRALQNLDKPKTIQFRTHDRELMRILPDLWDSSDVRQTKFEDMTVLVELVWAFLWLTKEKQEEAIQRMKVLVRRANLTFDDCMRLWRMRKYTTTYKGNTARATFDESTKDMYPDLITDEAWWAPCALELCEQKM